MEKYDTIQYGAKWKVKVVYTPGCTKHYLVHIKRQHKDFLKELDFVIEAFL